MASVPEILAKESDWAFDDENYESIIPEKFRWRNWAKGDKSPTGDELLHFVNDELFPALKNIPVTASTDIRKSIVRSVFEDTNQCMKDGVQLYKVVNGIGIKNIREKHITELIIPLPPIDEQHKIAERLKELLPLCEALEK